MLAIPLVVCALFTGAVSDRPAEKQVVATITATDLEGGIVSEITWDEGLLVLQGVFAAPTGQLEARYVVVPADGVGLRRLPKPGAGAVDYWQRKSNRVSPTGLGRITASTDAKMPYYGVGSQPQRFRDAIDMGGTQQRHEIRLGLLVLFDRTTETAPYDGETYSWSPAVLNRIAYTDGKGDLWVAGADGSRPLRLLRGDYTLPAWSDDGRVIALAERKDGGRRWEISLVYLPEELRAPPR